MHHIVSDFLTQEVLISDLEDLVRADGAKKRMSPDWSTPAFVPTSELALPHCASGEKRDPRTDPFPAKGLFISARGAKTGLHVDPWCSDALLFQFHGRKKRTMYSPDQRDLLSTDGAVVNLDAVDHEKFPRFADARPTYEFELLPGEAVFVL